MRLLITAILSVCLFFPAYWLLHALLGADCGGIIAAILMYIIFPITLLNIWKGKPDLFTLPVNMDDPFMVAGISQAKSDLPRLLQGLSEGKLEAYVKFPYQFDGEVEHVWGVAHQYKDENIILSLASAPVGNVDEEAFGRLTIPLSEIEDWMLVDANGNTQGGYTILAMAQIYARDYGKLPKKHRNDLKRFVDFSWHENTEEHTHHDQ